MSFCNASAQLWCTCTWGDSCFGFSQNSAKISGVSRQRRKIITMRVVWKKHLRKLFSFNANVNFYVRCIFIIANFNEQISVRTFCMFLEINEMLKNENLFNKTIITQIQYSHPCLLIYLLTPWSRVLLDKLTNSQLVTKFPTFYGTRRFITIYTGVRHLSLSWASSIQSIPPHLIKQNYIHENL
jgi:hypothetical protein